MYPPELNPQGYFQRKDVHFVCSNLNLSTNFYPDYIDNTLFENSIQSIINGIENSDPYETYIQFYEKLLPFMGDIKKLTESELTAIIKPGKYNYPTPNIPPQTKYIYNLLTSNNYSTFNQDVYDSISKIKPNDKCFCDSGKKFKKCCK